MLDKDIQYVTYIYNHELTNKGSHIMHVTL